MRDEISSFSVSMVVNIDHLHELYSVIDDGGREPWNGGIVYDIANAIGIENGCGAIRSTIVVFASVFDALNDDRCASLIISFHFPLLLGKAYHSRWGNATHRLTVWRYSIRRAE